VINKLEETIISVVRESPTNASSHGHLPGVEASANEGDPPGLEVILVDVPASLVDHLHGGDVVSCDGAAVGDTS